jgi:hypothetical protein
VVVVGYGAGLDVAGTGVDSGVDGGATGVSGDVSEISTRYGVAARAQGSFELAS